MSERESVPTSQGIALPVLPSMLLRAVPTVVRNGKVAGELNALTAQYHCPAITHEHLQAYHAQFPGLVSNIPLTYFYLLAQRAHLALMLDERFPWPILGMVHVANRMEYFAKPNMSEAFTLDVQIEFPPRAGTRKRVRPMYLVDFYQGEQRILRCSSAYQVGAGQKSPPRRGERADVLPVEGYEVGEQWLLESHLGRRYARLSGDYNPIHLHPWLSRWFGFSRPIIHGMYSVGRVQATLEAQSGKEVQMLDIGFRRPVVLPTSLLCLFSEQENKVMVTDIKRTRSFLDGSYALAEASSAKA